MKDRKWTKEIESKELEGKCERIGDGDEWDEARMRR